MAYISAIAIDFGSSNTGVARIDHFENGKLTKVSHPKIMG